MRAIELFAGGGGLSVGLHRAGFDCAAAFEFDAHACGTLRGLAHVAEVRQEDVRGVDWAGEAARLGELDLVAGGPPCQSFSSAGLGLGAADRRNGWDCAVEAVAGLRPRAFLFENVRNLTTARHRDYFGSVLGRLRELGYSVRAIVLNAADFGVAQYRRRVFVVGLRDSAAARALMWPRPTHLELELVRAKWVTGSYWRDYPGVDARAPRPGERALIAAAVNGSSRLRWRTVRDALGPAADLAPVNLTTADGRFCLDRPAPAVTTSPGGRETLVVLDSRMEPRWLTWREAATVQGFPDSHPFAGNESARYRQVGNAVPILLAEAVGRAVADALRVALSLAA